MFRIATFWAVCLAVVRAAVLVDFQVAQPPVVPVGGQKCTIEVFRHDFANSFGMSEIVELTPPTDCGPPGSWAAVTLNFTVTSNGTQFDRLGIFTFKNVEIWRTSTPEPTLNGIIWTYVKDVSQYIPLFETPGTLILQLDNLIETGLNGVYSTTLEATYYAPTEDFPSAPKADLIIPISTLSNTTGNDASVPPIFSLNITLPVNAVNIYAELFASGNGDEEFWYFNAANDFIGDLPPNTAFGDGPFREVRLLIDGQVAGIAFPYAVIFTGGISPPLWRPITSYGALELPTYFIDVTPFVPLLTDGNPHNFSLDVVSAETDHDINPNWFVSGLLQVITDTSSKPTTGRITTYDVSPFATTSASAKVSDGGASVDITVKATRSIRIESTIVSGSGAVTDVVWTQDYTYSNLQSYRDNTIVQNVTQTSKGAAKSLHNGKTVLSDVFEYPLDIGVVFGSDQFNNWTTTVDHSYIRSVLANPLVLEKTINNHQQAEAFFEVTSSGNFGNGSSGNVFDYSDEAGNTFRRAVNANLNVITLDEESGTLASSTNAVQNAPLAPEPVDSTFSTFRLPGGRA